MLFNKIIFKNQIFSTKKKKEKRKKKKKTPFLESTTIGKDIHFFGSQYKAFTEPGHLT